MMDYHVWSEIVHVDEFFITMTSLGSVSDEKFINVTIFPLRLGNNHTCVQS